jgi:serine/threonine protein phosphatase PrpC
VTTTNEETTAAPDPFANSQGGSKAFPYGFLTDVGRVREINQDSVSSDPSRGLFIVADGMGGHLAGEKASISAVETIDAMLTHEALRVPAADLPRLIRDAVQAANRVIVQASLSDASMRGMGTTTTMAVAASDLVVVGHIGDSRAYLLTASGIEQVTEDHSVVAQLLRARAITPAEALRHPYRNVITKCLGMQMEVEADITTVRWGAGDALLICSDGLSGLVSDEEMHRVVYAASHPQQACEQLVALANERGGHDNISVVVFHHAS